MPENQDIGNWRGSGIDWFENIVAIRKEKRYRTESRWRSGRIKNGPTRPRIWDTKFKSPAFERTCDYCGELFVTKRETQRFDKQECHNLWWKWWSQTNLSA